MQDPETNAQEARAVLASNGYPQLDAIFVDGLYRNAIIEIACDILAVDGAIVCDNAEGYGFQEGFKWRSLDRVDFYQNAPEVILQHCDLGVPSLFIFSLTIRSGNHP